MYIKIDDNGEYSFYSKDIHSKEIIEQSTEIDDELYNYLLENNGKLVFDITKTNIIKENFITRVYEDLGIVEPESEFTNEKRLQAVEDAIMNMMMEGGV